MKQKSTKKDTLKKISKTNKDRAPRISKKEIEQILIKINEIQNITAACIACGYDAQEVHNVLKKQGQRIDRVYELEALPDQPVKQEKVRRYHLQADISEIVRVLNETQNFELTCIRMGVSNLGITNLVKRSGYRIARRYIIRDYTEEERDTIAQKEAKNKARQRERIQKKQEKTSALTQQAVVSTPS